MNITPAIGIPASIAGSPLAQLSGSDADRARTEISAQQRTTATDLKAEAAADVSDTDDRDLETSDRDADGRRIWEFGHGHAKSKDKQPAEDTRRSRDPSGEAGGQLDLSG